MYSIDRTGRRLASAIIFGAMFVMPAGAQAQVACDSPEVVKHLPADCKTELVTASGNQRPTRRWALKTARDGWQDQVIAKYGERLARWTRAACLKEECFASAIGGFKRCILSGYPCIEKPKPEQISALSKTELKEMQKLLNKLKARPRLRVDGIFGLKSVMALEYWQKKQGIKVDGMANLPNLELLRKAS